VVVAINTKFNFGDEVYLVMPGHDYYVEKTPYKVVSFDVDVSPNYTKVRYLIEQNGNISNTIEDFLFGSYEEALAWSEEQQLARAENRPRVSEEAFANPDEKGGT
jgi:hypothetical protein